ncbi:alpha/beta hydrolase family esterase [Actinoplanes aureus]|uniref:Polyhydroxybutyrate depolymerase n=1 Tax=Actinoplanes aureus TaxID=2792083 RepID=A0A931CKH3_9ACTN|nr:alpha/beta fold hydrolase [Actinoplanes aureus]MBG0569033.1 hypothetical protein [Actinoplanes aureus]
MARHWQQAARAMTVAVAVLVTLACGGSNPSAPVEIGGRAVNVHVPDSYDPARPAPLVLGLHGYTSSPRELEMYLRLTAESDRHGFIYAYPDGSTDHRGRRYWNATDACCAFSDPEPDDSRYLSELISSIQNSYRIDPSRVYLIGHSNGGFMSFRMACDHADQITAIVSLNGATWNDAARCRPSEPVSVLAIHSSNDEIVTFSGGAIDGTAYPSAASTVAQWVGHNRCAETGRDEPALDLVTDLPAAETSIRTYVQGCADGSSVQAWTINGGVHVPQLGPAFAPAVTDFLLSQTKPAR